MHRHLYYPSPRPAELLTGITQTPAIRDVVHSHYNMLSSSHEQLPGTTSILMDEGIVMPSQGSVQYIPVPTQSKKKYAVRRIPLTNGNLVVDIPVPDRLLKLIPLKDEEFRTMRYTAATCQPDDFFTEGYSLRQQDYKRSTELLIGITMYNEDDNLFLRTMQGVRANITHLCNLEHSPMWGPDGWKKVVVAIVADGRNTIHPRVLSALASMGIYQPGVAKNMVDDKPVQAHIYEFTTQIAIDDKSMTFRGAKDCPIPIQVVFCLKEKNAKKINSHRWLFNAFGPCLQPNVCVLLDVGTRPDKKSILELWKTFHDYPQVGGACGEIRATLGHRYHHLWNPLVAAQNFEYKISNILDKPTESVFGYISVLPGAFSAYRYSAIQNNVNGQGPLHKYFLGEQCNHGGLFAANMYLAEDRVLCFELVAKQHERWLLRYCDTAFAETDVPDSLPEFISQRRRWLNGSFFAGVYSLWNAKSIFSTSHTRKRISLLCIESIYTTITLIFQWFIPANFYLVFYFITKCLADEKVDPFGNGWGERLFTVVQYIYIFTLVIVVICSLGNRPQGSRFLFGACLFIFALLMMYMLFSTGWMIYETISLARDQGNQSLLSGNNGFLNMLISVLATIGLYTVSSLVYGDPWHMITSFIPYMLFLPGYANILTIYAFCNTHDVSWGTKGDTSISKDLGVVKTVSHDEKEKTPEVELELPVNRNDIDQEYDNAVMVFETKQPVEPKRVVYNQEDGYRSFRTHLVLLWIATNAVLVGAITSTGYTNVYDSSVGNIYLLVILWVNAALAMFRFSGSLAYRISSLVSRR